MSEPLSRGELMAKYPAMDRDIYRSDDEADANVAFALTGHKPVGRWRDCPDGRSRFFTTALGVLSPGARNHQRISDAIDEAKAQKKTVPEPAELARFAAVDYQHSNLPDRGHLPYDPDGYELEDVYSIDSREDRHKLLSSLTAAEMGEPGVSIVLSDPNVPSVTPRLPWKWRGDDGDATPSAAVFPVGFGFSPLRVAQLVMHFLASQCRWCDRADGRPDFGLLCSAGETVYLFPTCRNCRDELASFFADGDHGSTRSLDFIVNDGECHGTGWPADPHR